MIYGIGTDLVEIKRFQRISEEKDSFISHYYSQNEQALISQRKHPARCMAMNFAGKEAVAKAFHTGFCRTVIAREIEILRTSSGAPYVKLSGQTAAFAAELQLFNIQISLSDEGGFAIAYVTMETNTNENAFVE